MTTLCIILDNPISRWKRYWLYQYRHGQKKEGWKNRREMGNKAGYMANLVDCELAEASHKCFLAAAEAT